MRGFGGIMQGVPSAAAVSMVSGGGLYISPQISLYGAPHPRVGTLGLQTYVGVFDGELYNREALAKELATLGYRFATDDDTALVLHAYMAWGAGCLERFVGIFALAIWNEECLFMARDRVGGKSLFYRTSNRWQFATSWNLLFTEPEEKLTLTAEGAAELLLLGPGRTPGCGVLEGFHELQPGHYLQYRLGDTPKPTRYWTLQAHPHLHDFPDTCKHVQTLLNNAVSEQSDKNTGVLLSGGLDSSILAALARCKSTFSLDFIGNDATDESDAPYIKEMTQHLRADHQLTLLGTDELADALPAAMEARGLPGMADVDASLLLFFQRIHEKNTVVLSGDGADEFFGGYPWFIDEALRNGKGFPWSNNVEYRAGFLHPRIRQQIDAAAFVQKRFDETIGNAPTLYDDTADDKQVRRLTALHFHWFMQTLNTRTAAMAAAAGMTVRMPFLDHRVLEYMYNVPWVMKNHDNREKGLLRQAFKSLLPKKIVNRKKAPFPKTHNPAFTQKVTDLMQNLLNKPYAPLFQILNRQNLNAQSNTHWYGQLMARPQMLAYFLQINAWLEKYDIRVAL
ncbi:MAG: asparagine synthase (glutamine-hydrolyzing) [Defluviitaleaceae bacterium]|nr:asparagine synthase (glutamine-hydrolyzing) [Defluviitaleaceae bacterium]